MTHNRSPRHFRSMVVSICFHCRPATSFCRLERGPTLNDLRANMFAASRTAAAAATPRERTCTCTSRVADATTWPRGAIVGRGGRQNKSPLALGPGWCVALQSSSSAAQGAVCRSLDRTAAVAGGCGGGFPHFLRPLGCASCFACRPRSTVFIAA